ncbi:MAG TPA: peptidoglycan-binding domain-containing protein [Streptosporangiaceae bacterium]|nr:peptidoglycan-binding domain-containing protein [Streptosporangiaceae bacterium]
MRGSRLARRRRVLFAVGGGAALLAIGGLIGSSFVKSPQQIAADTAAPPPTVTTEKVISQVLTSSVQMRGVVYPATQYDVYPSAPETATDTGSAAGGSAAGGSSATGGGSSAAVYISRLDVAAGKTISNGEELAAIDGEPLFVLAGHVPAWRDVTPGESGPDVAELQKALGSLGYYQGGDTPGYFGTATQDAVALYYEHLGYTPPATGGVPMTDVVFLPSLPAKVIAVNGAKGQQPGQPFLELAARGSLALTGELPPAYAAQVKPGLQVKIYDEVTGVHATGTVSEVGTATTIEPVGAIVNVGGGAASATAGESTGSGASGTTGTAGTAGSGSSGNAQNSGTTAFIPLAVHPSKPLRAALNGENVLVTVETGRTEGPVLTVPVAAVVTTGSGTSYVTVAGVHGKQTQVPVTPGISENGYVQVTPVKAGQLAVGDSVVVSG